MNITPEQLREIALRLADTVFATESSLLDYAAALLTEFQKLQAEQEPVAVIGDVFQMLWCRHDWSKGLRVGDYLYAAPPDLAAKVAELEATIRRLEVERGQSQFCAECNQLAVQNQVMREALAYVDRFLPDHVYESDLNPVKALALALALALPDLAEDILKKRDVFTIANFLQEEGKWVTNDAMLKVRDAETLRKTADMARRSGLAISAVFNERMAAELENPNHYQQGASS